MKLRRPGLAAHDGSARQTLSATVIHYRNCIPRQISRAAEGFARRVRSCLPGGNRQRFINFLMHQWPWERAVMDDAVRIVCTKCRSRFTDRARRIQSGYSRQCPACEVVMFFDEGTTNRNIRQALLEASRLRRALRAAEDERRATSASDSSEQTQARSSLLTRGGSFRRSTD